MPLFATPCEGSETSVNESSRQAGAPGHVRNGRLHPELGAVRVERVRAAASRRPGTTATARDLDRHRRRGHLTDPWKHRNRQLQPGYDVTRDPKTRNVQKSKGLFLRGEQEGELTANQLSLAFRNQFALTPRSYLYGQVEYLRDTFKLIDYLVAPTAGIGFKVIDTQPTKLSVDGGIGAVWEKNPGFDVDTSLALTAGEKLEHQLTPTTTLKHAATALWKADDFADGLYTISVGVGVKISDYLQLSVDLLDTFKNRRPNAATDKNDIAFMTALAAKF